MRPDVRKDSQYPGPDGSVTAIAFEALLDALRKGTTSVPRGGGHGKTSPSQMFEVKVGDTHDQRRATLKAQYRSDLSEKGDTLHDSTSIQARRAMVSRKEGETRLPSDVKHVPSSETSASGRRTPTNMNAERPVWTAESLGSDRPHRGEVPSTDGRFALRSQSLSNSPEALAPPSSAAAASGVACAAPASPTVGSGSPPAQTPAQQVGHLLGAAMVGEVESTRAAGSTPATSDARSPGTDSKMTPRPKAGEQGHARSTAQHVDDAPSKTGQTSRSVFDQLVRSIRLNTGARLSSAQLQLEPPQLGRLFVNVRVDGDQVRINVRTETEAVRDLVAHRVDQLTVALQQHGISIERFEVVTDGSGDSLTESADRDTTDSKESPKDEREEGYESPMFSDNNLSLQDIGASLAREMAPQAVAAGGLRLDIQA